VSDGVADRVAVLVVRDGVLPAGADAAVAEAGGSALLLGSGTRAAAAELTTATQAQCAEIGAYAPAAWSWALANLQLAKVTILPASPDGRDLAPRLAAATGRPLLAAAIEIHDDGATLLRADGQRSVRVRCETPFVATLVPGPRSTEPLADRPRVSTMDLALSAAADAVTTDLLPADPATMDLAESSRILGAGAGLRGPADLAALSEIAAAWGASVGATRVLTDAGWIEHSRQIGTTGVVVDPELYVAFGVSGAAQHLGGLGAPRHVVSVNTDPSCPLTAMADLGIVTDAGALVDELRKRAASERDQHAAG
jgi:electron transfer flavoprotein alpha subunit